MTAPSRPLIVVAGPIHPDGHALLESQARVDNPPFNLDNGVCSTHVAGVTRQSTRRAALQGHRRDAARREA